MTLPLCPCVGRRELDAAQALFGEGGAFWDFYCSLFASLVTGHLAGRRRGRGNSGQAVAGSCKAEFGCGALMSISLHLVRAAVGRSGGRGIWRDGGVVGTSRGKLSLP